MSLNECPSPEGGGIAGYAVHFGCQKRAAKIEGWFEPLKNRRIANDVATQAPSNDLDLALATKRIT